MHVDLSRSPPSDRPQSFDGGGPANAGGRPFARVLGEAAAAQAPGAAALDPGPPAGGAPAPLLTRALARLTDGGRATDALIAAAARGRTFTPAQLLALQAAVSRDAQTVELVSRAADRLVGTVKQALGTPL